MRTENARLKSELRRAEEEGDILKKSRKILCQRVRLKYRFIQDHRDEFSIVSMWRVLRVNRAGFYV